MASRKISRLAVVLIVFAISVAINGQEPPENKCGSCPCNNPCSVPPPPPPPSPPPPPPPAPKPPKPGQYCPPPPPPKTPSGPTIPTPPSQYVYYSGPPGSLYPIDQSFSGAAGGFTVGLPLLIGSILLALW